MFSTLVSFGYSSFRKPQRSQSLRRKLAFELLENRALPSGGLNDHVISVIVDHSGSNHVAQVAELEHHGGSTPSAIVPNQSSGGSGSSGGGPGNGGSGPGAVFLSGPGYPLAPTSGPARPDPATLAQPTTTTTLVPMGGASGGPGPSLALVPVVTSGTSLAQ